MKHPMTLACAIMLALAGAASSAAWAAAELHPPIPVRFTLQEPGFVTLVIEDASGQRVRNLVSETPFPAGENTAWWDGLDDLGRDPEAAEHAVYHIPGKLVAPGTYRVRGLVRPRIDLRYEFSVYHEGNPPWSTADKGSQWLANHTPPSAVLFVPEDDAPVRPGKPAPGGQIIAASKVSEGGSGVAWLDLDGHKLHGQMWIGGVWTGATHLARDEGDAPVPGVYAYTASAWQGDQYNGGKPELRLFQLLRAADAKSAPRDTRFGFGEDRAVLKPNFTLPPFSKAEDAAQYPLSGLAVRNGLVVVALGIYNQLLFVDAKAGRVVSTTTLERPRGLAFDRRGRLFAVSGRNVVRFEGAGPQGPLSHATVLVAAGLEDPQQLTLDQAGNLYVSDLGGSHQVKVFSAEGKFRRAIGRAGRPGVGPYDPEHMNNPAGITIDGRGRLWVAEQEFAPKRVSIWTPEGKLVRAFYGPPRYGGGGRLDGGDPSRFFYADAGGIEFKLDWKNGTNAPAAIYYRPELDTLKLTRREAIAPEQPLHAQGRTYLTDAYNVNPTGGSDTVSLWLLERGVARPVAALGDAGQWDQLGTAPQGSPFAARLPKGANLKKDKILFAWSDLNGDGKPQPEEITTARGETRAVSIMEDLSAVTASGLRFQPQGFTPTGAPIFDVAKAEVVARDTQRPTSSGGGQALLGQGGWLVLTTAPGPFAPQGIGGVLKGVARWSYPSLWPGLHAGHNAPLPDQPGEVLASTRLLGLPVRLQGGDVELWAINGDKGNVYLFTTDGLFVATLFKDGRTAAWDMPKAERGMLVNGASLSAESFWPSLAQTPDGQVYLVVNWPSILRVEGLDKIRRLPETQIEITPALLQSAQAFFVQREAARQAESRQTNELTVARLTRPPVVDGKVGDWPSSGWVTIDERTQQVGDWGHRAVKTEAALAISGDRLYAAFRTTDRNLLNNAGDSLPLLFKSGGALDLMLGTDAGANPKRRSAAAGDLRLLITRVKGQPLAVLYRPLVPGTGRDKFPFASPLRTILFDRVDNVTAAVTLASDWAADPKDNNGRLGTATYEFSLPLATLGLEPRPGLKLRGDIGVLRGNGTQTLQRVYWSNKASGSTADVPSEAELLPSLWGVFNFQ